MRQAYDYWQDQPGNHSRTALQRDGRRTLRAARKKPDFCFRRSECHSLANPPESRPRHGGLRWDRRPRLPAARPWRRFWFAASPTAFRTATVTSPGQRCNLATDRSSLAEGLIPSCRLGSLRVAGWHTSVERLPRPCWGGGTTGGKEALGHCRFLRRQATPGGARDRPRAPRLAPPRRIVRTRGRLPRALLPGRLPLTVAIRRLLAHHLRHPGLCTLFGMYVRLRHSAGHLSKMLTGLRHHLGVNTACRLAAVAAYASIPATFKATAVFFCT